MVRLGEEKAEAELVDRALDPLGLELEPEAERLEHVGGTRRGRCRTVAVLRDAGAGAGRDECRGGRDVVRVRAVAPGADDVDEICALRVDREHMLSHRLGAARDLVGRLALRAQGDEKAGDLRLRRFAAHDRVHRLARVLAREVAAVEHLRERLLDHSKPSRKLRASVGPSGRQHGLGVELHADDRQRAVAHRHHLAVLGVRGRLEHVGQPRRGERVIAPCVERLRQIGEEAGPVVLHGARLPVQQLLRIAHLAAEGLDDRLVPEADAEGRDRRRRSGGRCRPRRRRRQDGRGRGRRRGATARAARRRPGRSRRCAPPSPRLPARRTGARGCT